MSDVGNSLYQHPALYDAEFYGYRADVRFYAMAVARHPGRVVELGCGTGRLLMSLDVADYVGVDLAPAMLQMLRWRASAVGQPPPVLRADLRALPLRDGSAALCILAYNVLQHMMELTDLVACLSEAARVAGPGGAVALDTFMPPLPGMSREDEGYGWVEQRRHPQGYVMDVAERTVHNPATEVQVTQLRFQPRVAQAGEQEVTITRRLWHAEALVHALTRAGLRVEILWGDVDGEAWTPRAPRFMAVCRRA
ncbi:MAG: class I SAM-dependent methyltransferase [Myxococcota bacterium]